MENKRQNIIIDNEERISIAEVRQLTELAQKLNLVLNFEEFFKIVSIYNECIERLVVIGKEQGIEI